MLSPFSIAVLTLADIPASYHEPGLTVRVVRTNKFNCTAYVFKECALGGKDAVHSRTPNDVYFFGKRKRWYDWLFGQYIRLERLNMHIVHPKRHVIHGHLIHTSEYRISPGTATEL